jgi:hypothetical protein
MKTPRLWSGRFCLCAQHGRNLCGNSRCELTWRVHSATSFWDTLSGHLHEASKEKWRSRRASNQAAHTRTLPSLRRSQYGQVVKNLRPYLLSWKTSVIQSKRRLPKEARCLQMKKVIIQHGLPLLQNYSSSYTCRKWRISLCEISYSFFLPVLWGSWQQAS